MVPPFDHEWIIAGQGTAGLEILDQLPDVAAVLVPVGGGGLVAGVAAAIKLSRRDVKVIGVEPAGAAKMKTSVDAGHPVTLQKTETVADGLMPVRPGDLTFAHVQKFVDHVITVDDKDIIAAVLWIFANAQARRRAERRGHDRRRPQRRARRGDSHRRPRSSPSSAAATWAWKSSPNGRSHWPGTLNRDCPRDCHG